MTIRARVTLQNSLTHDSGTRHFEKNKPQILTNAKDIAYYQCQAGFLVTILHDDSKKDVKPTTVKQIVPKEEIIAKDLPIQITQENNVEPEPEPENDDLSESIHGYSDDVLRKKKKKELIQIADELGLDTDGTVNQLIERILEV